MSPTPPAGAPPAVLERFRLAMKHHRAGEYAAAEQIYSSILSAQRDFAPALHYLGVLSAQTGRNQRAVELIREALRLQPDMPDAWNHLGIAYYSMERYAEAHECYRRALARDPRDAVLLMNLANLLRDEKRYDEAESRYRDALSLDPAYPDTPYNYGICLLRQERFDDAEAHLRRALELRPGNAEAHHALGRLQIKQERFDEARASLQQALRLDPRHTWSIRSLAQIAQRDGNRERALELMQRAVDLEPGNPECHNDLALARLACGELRAGYDELEWRWGTRQFKGAHRPCRHPLWDGSDLAGKGILVWREQGLGDEILYSGMVPDLAAAGARVVLECDARLVALFSRSFPGVEVVAQQAPLDPRTEADRIAFQSPLASLCRWLRPDFSRFPRHAGYLKADPGRVSSLRENYRRLAAGRKVIGISWHSRRSPAGMEKSTRLADWADILASERAFFVNLQYGDCAGDLEALRTATGLTLHTDPGVDALGDPDALAAQVRAMDLVISASNTTVHFAGAQNVPCWTLVPSGPGALWYWFTGRADSPWYPSMRLVRRRPEESWRDVLARIGAGLAAFLGAR